MRKIRNNDVSAPKRSLCHCHWEDFIIIDTHPIIYVTSYNGPTRIYPISNGLKYFECLGVQKELCLLLATFNI